MIASALAELAASAGTSFPVQLAAVATKYGVTLFAPGQVQTWFEFETEQVRTSLVPNASAVMSVQWAGDATTQLARPSAGVRDTTMHVIVTYIYKDTDSTVVQNHLQYVPEAMLQWLDAFPIASRAPGATITKIAPPLGKKIMIRQKKETVREANNVTTYVWHAEAEFDIEIRDVVVIDISYAAYLAFDSVTRADSTTSAGNCTEKGGAWTAVQGTWGVFGNALYAVVGGVPPIITLALGAPAGAFGYRVVTDAIESRTTELYIRYVDLLNHLFVTSDGGILKLWATVAGTSNARIIVAQPSTGLPAFGAASFTVSAMIAANVVTCFVNGAQVGTPYTLTAGEIAAFGASQNVGLIASGGGNGTASTVDNITATP